MNKQLISLLLSFVLFSISATSVAAGSTPGSTPGSIMGVINHCDDGGVAGMMVYIPGKPQLVITGTDGKFLLQNVDAGDYTLYFMLNSKIMNFNKWVKVQADKTSDLQLIEFCDKVTLATPEPSPSTETTTQLTTIPQNLESICEQESEGTLLPVINGKAVCKNSKLVLQQCNKGFSDCDQSMLNGCEVDIMNDDENCGACFNACGDQDSCQLGIC